MSATPILAPAPASEDQEVAELIANVSLFKGLSEPDYSQHR